MADPVNYFGGVGFKPMTDDFAEPMSTAPTPMAFPATPQTISAKRLRELAAVPMAPLLPPSQKMTAVEMRRWLAISETQAERIRVYLQLKKNAKLLLPGARRSEAAANTISCDDEENDENESAAADKDDGDALDV
ncbi:hypothetical protein KEM52_001747 [Ascosphaera acerosa]|nr:hypothetical protein KEM52_001747 [Ascosphaera acerosa]